MKKRLGKLSAVIIGAILGTVFMVNQVFAWGSISVSSQILPLGESSTVSEQGAAS